MNTGPNPIDTGIPSGGHAKLRGIQYARALAALLVVICHLGPQFTRMGYTPKMWNGLAGGVDIFFVISGLIMWVTVHDRPVSPATFLKKRIARIVPLYWIVTSITVICIIVAPHLVQSASFDTAHILASYAFIAWRNPATGLFEPLIIPGWTLNYEMFFYVIFSLSLFTRGRFRLVAVVTGLVGLVTIGLFLKVDASNPASFYTASILLEFAFGMLLGEVYLRGHLLNYMSRYLALFIFSIGLLVLITAPSVVPQWPRIFQTGLAALAVVTGVLALDAKGTVFHSKTALLLGDASYSLYLIHPIILSAVGQFWRKAQLAQTPLGLLGFAIIAVLLCCLVSQASYRWVEKPLLRYFSRRKPLLETGKT